MRSPSSFIKYPVLHIQGRLRLTLRKGIFYDEDSETLVQAVQRSGGFSTLEMFKSGWIGLRATWSRERCPSPCLRNRVRSSLKIPSDKTIWWFYVIITLNKHQGFTTIRWVKGIFLCRLWGSAWALVWSLSILSDMQTQDLGRTTFERGCWDQKKIEDPRSFWELKDSSKNVSPSVDV